MVLCRICAMSHSLSRSAVESVDFSNPLLGLGTVPITYSLRDINSRWERPSRNKREIKGQIETRLKQRLSQRIRRDDHPGRGNE